MNESKAPDASSDADEIVVNYFVLCDQVITEAQTNKQSLIGIYSALMAPQLPLHVNVAVALCLRVRTPQERKLIFRMIDPEEQVLFTSPPLPCDWRSVREGLKAAPSATLQIGLTLQAMPITKLGIYTALLYCDDRLVATYPLAAVKGNR